MKKTQSIVQRVQEIIADSKGEEPAVLDVRRLTDITDYMIIVSGTSTRHVRSIADKLLERMRTSGLRPLGLEGQQLGEWVLIDFGDVVVHIMRPQTRSFYSLEKLWNAAESAGAIEG